MYVGNWISDTAMEVFAPAAVEVSFCRPVRGSLTAAYDTAEEGLVSFRAEEGQVYAAAAGKVFYTGRNAAYGPYIRISHENGYETVYTGVTAGVAPGDRVEKGQAIGLCGKGQTVSFGLIYQGSYIDPEPLLDGE